MKTSILYSQILWAISVYPLGKEVWFSAGGVNGIFRADTQTGEVTFVSQFEIYERAKSVRFSCVIKVEDYIYFCPYEANCICAYNIETKEMDFFYSDEIFRPRVNNVIYMCDKLYMFCNNQPLIIIFNIKTKEISITKDKPFIKKYMKIRKDFHGKDIAHKEDSVYFTDGSKVIEVNLLSWKAYEYNMWKYAENGELLTITSEGDNFWMMSGKSKIIRWNTKINCVATYEIPELGNAVKSIINDRQIYILYDDCDKVLIFDLDEKKYSVVTVEQGYSHKEGVVQNFCPFVQDNMKGIYIYTYINHSIIYIEPDGMVSYVQLYMENAERFISDYVHYLFYGDKDIYIEKRGFWKGLGGYLQCIDRTHKVQKNSNSFIGAEIYDAIKNAGGV